MLVTVLGWLGACVGTGAYGLAVTGYINPTKRIYHWLTLVGCVGVGLSSFYFGALPSVFFCFLGAVLAVYALYGRKREQPNPKSKYLSHKKHINPTSKKKDTFATTTLKFANQNKE